MSFRPIPLALSLALWGCGDIGGSTGPTTPTLIAVAPKDFAGEVSCGKTPGAMQSYVATIFDLGTSDEPTAPLALPSGVVGGPDVYRPTSCLQTVAFGFVIAGHRYDAEVDVYDRSDLLAAGPGSRHLMDEATGEYVEPRWTTSCGRKDGSPAEGPVMAATFFTRFIRGCETLVTSAPTTPTGVSVSLEDALGQLTCGDAVDQVNNFQVTPAGSATGPLPVACGEEVVFDDLEPEETYFFDVAAFEKDALEPRWQTTCFRSTLPGTILPAACDPLTEIPDTAAP